MDKESPTEESIEQPQTDSRGNNRWHLDSCQDPDVIASGVDNIFCRACNRAPNISKLIERYRQQNTYSTSIPPDERYGEYNLWWPRTVPYKMVGVQKLTENGAAMAKTQQGAIAGTPQRDSPEAPLEISSEATGIYQERLSPNQFRLLCLPPANSNQTDSPIHVTLEAHDHERYPEYETVSYTWGGEGNDASLCSPIYVGPYWDVLLQTKNCWDMLKFLQSPRCPRLVWVDAICINQSDKIEKGIQVAKMRFIYKNCTRAVVWLGKDAAKPRFGCYPLRRNLNEACTLSERYYGPLENNDKVNLLWLLQHRYFSRVWIVQELLLSRQILIPVEDSEILVDSLSIRALGDLQNTTSPWLQYATQGRYLNLNVFQLMAATAKSKATDPRDKLYGLLGLTASTAFPDYTISYAHALIGVTAHYIFDLHCPDILSHAYGHKADGERPSWMVDVQQLASLKDWKEQPTQYGEERATLVKKFRQVFKENNNKIRRYPSLLEITGWEPPWSWLKNHKSTSGQHRVRDSLPWHHNGAVNTSSAALSINLTHLCSVKSSLKSWTDTYDSYDMRVSHCYYLDGATKSRVRLLMLSRYSALDKIVQPLDEIFILEKAELLFLILRPTGLEKSYRLVTCCESILIEWNGPSNASRWSWDLISTVELQYSLDNALTDLKGRLGRYETETGLYLPGVETIEGGLEIAEACLSDYGVFLDTYLRHVHPRFKPELQDEDFVNFVVLTVSVDDWDENSDENRRCSLWQHFREWRYAKDGEKGPWTSNGIKPNLKEPIRMRTDASVIVDMALDKEPVYREIEQVLRPAFRVTGGKSVDELLATPSSTPLGRFVASPQWPYEIVQDLEITGNTFQVTIY
ncbi:heterokaryon incompatibility protein-domain-containing protein [Cladorrhinum sp. PSN332]|nr:heterokaryon incompatibility protein-domain-containing protein [Cladorrhinum sp. PSN332]